MDRTGRSQPSTIIPPAGHGASSGERIRRRSSAVRELACVVTASLPAEGPTFLFTDIEGSTRLWEQHPEAMREALRHHDDLLRACIESHGGHVFKTVGDAFCAVFPGPRGAVEAMLAAQEWLPVLALDTGDGPRPLKVRMALHAGAAEERDG